MIIKLQIILGIIIISMILIICNMVRKKSIDLRYALGWMVLGAVMLVLDIFPNLIISLAKLAGISVPSNMVFLVGFLLAIIVIYSLTVALSHLSLKVKKLTQEMALLRADMESKGKE